MPTPTGIWYHWILLLRSASPRRCEKRGRFPVLEEKLRAETGVRRGPRKLATGGVTRSAAQLEHRP